MFSTRRGRGQYRRGCGHDGIVILSRTARRHGAHLWCIVVVVGGGIDNAYYTVSVCPNVVGAVEVVAEMQVRLIEIRGQK